MSLTNTQKRKLAKKKTREKRIRRMVNMRNNHPYLFALDAEIDGKWMNGLIRFRTWEQVLDYQERTERRRTEGEEIAPGRVRSLASNKVVLEIRGSRAKDKTPDKIADGAKADPNVKADKTEEV